MSDAQPEEETSPTPVIPEEAPTRDPETGALLASEETPVVDPPAPAAEETATVQTDSTLAASTDVSDPPAAVSTENVLGTDAITNLVQISASLRSWVNALDAGIQVLQQESAK